MRWIFVSMLVAGLACAAMGQEFEAVSVKPNKSGSNSSHSRSDPGLYPAENVSLRSLIVVAYGLKDYQVDGPDWLRLERYDVTAKSPGDASMDREKRNAAFRVMMQKMLADRFKLVVHRDQKSFPVYGLLVGKNGIKFKEGQDCNTKGQSQDNDNQHFVGTCASMAAFAEFLSRRMELPVLDTTGLKGFYDLTLDWVEESKQSADGKGGAASVDIPSGPTLALAIEEQLGLKFDNRNAPIEILIVDHAEKSPTEN